MAPLSGSNRVAVIGMAGRLPGAPDLDAFWRNLREGVEAVRDLSSSELRASGIPDALISDPRYVPRKGVLDHVELFDAEFFGYAPREAAGMDPQQRIFLECAHQALEDAGHLGDDRVRVGVFAGSGYNTYAARLLARGALEPGRPELVPSLLGNAPDYLATRVSYKLGLTGPSMVVQTACSTSLVAVHLAVQSLLAGECDVAVAGGVTVRVPQAVGHLHQEGGILSADGHCRAFDATADGTVNGCGAGVVVLRRMDEALSDGDRVRAVILGSAVNNDGADKVAFTAPSVDAQADVISEAQAVAGVAPEEVSYVETHGTGTRLGDAIEMEALARVFGTGGGRCLIGSVKTGIGHLDAAAGISSLVKTVLALEHGEIPPSLHFRSPSPAALPAFGRFAVNTRACAWPRRGDAPRRAGVSSFGFGGTNAHVVLEEAPPPPPTDPPRPWSVVCLSARTPSALEELTNRLRERLCGVPGEELADAAFTLQTGRRALRHRRAWVCPALEGGRRVLEEPGAVHAWEGAVPSLVFWLAGGGARVSADLHATEPAFRRALDECAEALVPHLDADVRTPGAAPPGAVRFASLYAAGRMWIAWGVRPEACVAEQEGVWAALALTGALPLGEAARLAAVHSRLGAAALPVLVARSGAFDPAALAATPVFASGSPLSLDEVGDPGFWSALLEAPADPERLLGPLLRLPGRLVLAVAPEESAGEAPPGVVRCALDEREPAPALGAVHRALAALWLRGVEVDWHAYHAGSRRRRVALPTYPFERRRHWLEAPERPAAAAPGSDAAPGPGARLLTPGWRRAAPPLPGAEAPERSRWLVLAGDDPLSGGVLAWLRGVGADVAEVRAGREWARGEDGRFTVAAAGADHLARVLDTLAAEGRPVDRVVHLWALRRPAAPPAGEVDAVLDRAFSASFLLAKALGGRRGPGGVRVDVVTAGAREVTGGDCADPLAATVLGVCRAAPREDPLQHWRMVDVAPVPGGAEEEARLAEQLRAELLAAPADPLVALRGGHRWIPDATPLPLPEVAPAPPPAGTYLLTGGLGGVGGELARLLARRPGTSLALVARTPLPPRGEWALWRHRENHPVADRVRLVESLESLGARVRVFAADVTDPRALRQAVAEAVEHFDGLDAVVHAAGVAGGELLHTRGLDAARAVLAPKVAGTLNLLQAVAGAGAGGAPPPVFLCSSLVGTTGGAGQADYAAANAFLDAFAEWCAPRSPGVVAVAWDRWDGVGMAAGATEGRPVELARWPWLGEEHRVGGLAVLPGTAMLGWVVEAAASPRTGERPEWVGMDEVVFLRPLEYRTDARVRVSVEPGAGDDGVAASLESRDGARLAPVVHLRARLAPQGASGPEAEVLDLEALRRRAPGDPGAALPDRSAELGLELGPRWSGVRSVAQLGPGEWLAEVELPREYAADLPTGPFHPALADLATGFALRFAPPGLYVPAALYGVRVRTGLFPRRLFGHARVADASRSSFFTLTVTVADEDGRVWLRAERYVLRRVEAGGADSPGASRTGASAPSRPGLTPEQATALFARVAGERTPPVVLAVAGGLPRDEEPARDGALPSRDEAPADPLALVVAAWRGVLGIERVEPEDDFFSLGGDSVAALEVVAHLGRAGISVSPAELYEHSTPAALAVLVAAVLARRAETAAPEAERPGTGVRDETAGYQIADFPGVRLDQGELDELIAAYDSPTLPHPQ